VAFVDMLTLNSAVTVITHADTEDGMGGWTTATTTTVLAKAQIWQTGAVSALISDKYAKDSTHILAWRTSEYTMPLDTNTNTTSVVTYSSKTFKVRGPQNDVSNQGVVSTCPLEYIS